MELSTLNMASLTLETFR